MKILKRYLITFLLALGFGNLYMIRNSLSIALQAMVKRADTNETTSSECPVKTSTNSTATNINEGQFSWDENTQGLVLGSLYYGYVASHFIGGYLSEQFGGKLVYGLGVLVTSLLCLLSPIAAELGYKYFIALRALEGLSEGVTLPAIVCLISKWFSTAENALSFALVQVGGRFGTVIAGPLTALLCNSKGGWQSSFYLFGGLGAIYSLVWFIFAQESPPIDPTISVVGSQKNDRAKPTSVPWREVITCRNFWVALITHFGILWNYNFFLLNTPSYMNNILHFNLASNSLINSLPYVITMATLFLGGYIAKIMITKKWLSVTNTRKFLVGVGSIGSIIGLLGMALSRCDWFMVVFFFFIAEAMSAFAVISIPASLIDFAPSYADALMGVVNGIGNLSGILAPYMVGILTNDNQTIAQWNKIFFITIGINSFCAVLYMIFGSSKLQTWGSNKEIEPVKQNEEKYTYLAQ